MPKIQHTGKQFSITIPKEVIQKHGWKKGDILVFIDVGEVVTLQKKEKENEWK